MKIKHLKTYCQIASSPTVIQKATKVSLLVGSVLNLINQGDVLVTLVYENIHILKLLFTYLVPFSVTTYTATTLKMEFQIGTKAPIEADLICKKCKNEIHVHKNELIPECPKCGIKTKWKLK